MGQHILLADPRFVFRQGLRDFFTHTFHDASIEEASTAAAFKAALTQRSYDLVVVNQAFLLELAHVPESLSIILASQPNRDILLAACACQACAYLKDEPCEALLRIIPHLQAGDFWIDPAFSRWMLEQLGKDGNYHVPRERLTRREREIVELRMKGLSYTEIAEQLCIAVSTVKQHIVNIGRKQEKGIGRR